MAVNFRLQELRGSAESSFCENISSINSNTYTTRYPTVGLPSLSLSQPRIADQSAQSRNNVFRPGLKGTRSGTLEFTVYACGHLTAPTGALTDTWLYTLLSKGLGGGNNADSGTTVASGSSASVFVTSANPADYLPGSIIRVGAAADGRGNGQAAVVSTTATTTVNLLTALDGTPTAADVVYASLQAYPIDGYTDLGGTTTTMRFVCSNADTGTQWHMLGCQLQGLTIGISVGGVPTITFRYAVAYWDRVADTTPSAVAMSDDLAAPVAGADLFYQTFGTATRNTLAAQSLSLNLELGLIPHETVGADVPLQTITGWTRTGCSADLSVRLHTWDSAYETLWDSDGSGSTFKHWLFQSTTTAGRVFGFYIPRAFMSGPRPTRDDVNGLTGVSFSMKATESTTTTSNLTRSLVRFFMG